MLKVEFVLCSRHSYCAQLAVADARQPSVRASAAFFSTLNFHKIITLHTVTSDMALAPSGPWLIWPCYCNYIIVFLWLTLLCSCFRTLVKFCPVFVVGFLSFWFSWLRPSIQFVICLCIYDGFLTIIDLNHSALLADLALSEKDRTRLNAYSSLFAAIGSTSVFMSYYFWDKESIVTFQTFCVCLAVFSLFGFVISTLTLKHYFENTIHRTLENEVQR